MGEVRSPEDQWPGASSAGSVRCGDVTQQTGYPEAALARVLALTVGTGRRRGGLGEQCLDGGGGTIAQYNSRGTVYLMQLCRALGRARGKEI